MPPPPPPAPGPPPPGKMPPKASGGRKDLLGSIEGFKKGKLKKVATVDKSSPLSKPSSGPSSASTPVSSGNSPSVSSPIGGMGGLFAGGFPQLKKTNNRSVNPKEMDSTQSKPKGPIFTPPPKQSIPSIPKSSPSPPTAPSTIPAIPLQSHNKLPPIPRAPQSPLMSPQSPLMSPQRPPPPAEGLFMSSPSTLPLAPNKLPPIPKAPQSLLMSPQSSLPRLPPTPTISNERTPSRPSLAPDSLVSLLGSNQNSIPSPSKLPPLPVPNHSPSPPMSAFMSAPDSPSLNPLPPVPASNIITLVSLYRYKPNQPSDIELKEGDVIKNVNKSSSQWWQGTNFRTGMSGTFPSNYTKEIYIIETVYAQRSCSGSHPKVSLDVGDKVEVMYYGKELSFGKVDGKEGYFPSNCVSKQQPKVTRTLSKDVPQYHSHSKGANRPSPAPINREEKKIAKVLYSFKAQHDGDLTIKRGQKITIVRSKGAWWDAIGADDKVGRVPANYVQIIEE